MVLPAAWLKAAWLKVAGLRARALLAVTPAARLGRQALALAGVALAVRGVVRVRLQGVLAVVAARARPRLAAGVPVALNRPQAAPPWVAVAVPERLAALKDAPDSPAACLPAPAVADLRAGEPRRRNDPF